MKYIGFITFILILSFISHWRINANPVCDQTEENSKFDCYPDKGASEKGCLNRGCCWKAQQNNTMKLLLSSSSVPSCYFPKDFPNYYVVSSALTENSDIYSIQKSNATFRTNEILKLEVRVSFETKQRLRVQITDPQNARYQVPVFNNAKKDQESMVNVKDNTDFDVIIGNNPFSIKVYRKSTSKLM